MSFVETNSEKVSRLRLRLEQVHQALLDAEAALADQMADMAAFEFEFEANVGHLLDQLTAVEAEVNHYLDRIRQMRDEQRFGEGYTSVEKQFKDAWTPSSQAAAKDEPAPTPKPPSTPNEAQIKKLYRRLARAFHPDMAQDDGDRDYRTQMMAAVNDAYAARSMAELMAIERELAKRNVEEKTAVSEKEPLSEMDMMAALQNEITRCRRRLQEIDLEMQNLHNRSMVGLALEVKLARKEGRNLLEEMAADLERRIARKSVERDMLRTQFANLDRG